MPVHIHNCRYCTKKDKGCQIRTNLFSYKIKEHVSYKCKELETRFKPGDPVSFDYISIDRDSTGRYPDYPTTISQNDGVILNGEILNHVRGKMYIVDISKEEYDKLKDFPDIQKRCSEFPSFDLKVNRYSIPVREENIDAVDQLKNKLITLLK